MGAEESVYYRLDFRYKYSNDNRCAPRIRLFFCENHTNKTANQTAASQAIKK